MASPCPVGRLRGAAVVSHLPTLAPQPRSRGCFSRRSIVSVQRTPAGRGPVGANVPIPDDRRHGRRAAPCVRKVEWRTRCARGPWNARARWPTTPSCWAPGRSRVRAATRSCCTSTRAALCRTDLHLVEGDLAPRGQEWCPATRSSAGSSTRGARRRPVRSRRPGRHRLAAQHLRRVPLVPGAGPRTSARARRTPAGTPTAASPSTPWCRPPTPTRCPSLIDDEQVAPLLCAGIIGYRALRRAELPPGGRLGIYGFGSSAHITAQVALAQGAEVHVMTRGEGAQALARDLGAAWVGGPRDAPPVPARLRDRLRARRRPGPGRAAARSTAAGRSRSPGST